MRSRNIKPGFFQNEDLVELDLGTRLLFIGLWLVADRAGRLEDRPKKIKMQVFPADSLDVDPMLGQLADKGLITRYSVDSMRYIEIPAWDKHQNPHVKEKPSTIPEPDLHSSGAGNSGASPADSLIPDSLIPDSLIPDSLQGAKEPDFESIDNLNMEAWEKWLTYRRSTNKAKYKTTGRAKALAKLPHEMQMLCVESSIDQMYVGIFPENFNGKVSKKRTYAEQLKVDMDDAGL